MAASPQPGRSRVGRRISSRRESKGEPSELDQTGWALLLALWLTPLVSWAVLLTFAFRVQFSLDLWPKPGQPAPGELNWLGHQVLSWICLGGTTAGLILALAVASFHAWDQRQQRRRALLVGVIVLGIWLASWMLPPFHNLLLWLVS